jgi:predicted nucleic acid-binding protein
MVYVDTSVLVPLFVNEPHSAAAVDWYSNEKSELVAATWCVTEFASALGIKQRTGALDGDQAQAAWARFERMVAADLRLLPIEPSHFHRAAQLVLDASSALRAGDALHLACAEAAGAKRMATLDDVLGRNAQRLKIRSVGFSLPKRIASPPR